LILDVAGVKFSPQASLGLFDLFKYAVETAGDTADIIVLTCKRQIPGARLKIYFKDVDVSKLKEIERAIAKKMLEYITEYFPEKPNKVKLILRDVEPGEREKDQNGSFEN